MNYNAKDVASYYKLQMKKLGIEAKKLKLNKKHVAEYKMELYWNKLNETDDPLITQQYNDMLLRVSQKQYNNNILCAIEEIGSFIEYLLCPNGYDGNIVNQIINNFGAHF